MVDDFDNQEVRSSGELWTEICSGLPGVPTETAAENDAEFRDSFYPESLGGDHQNGLTNGTSCSSSSSATWKPMEDSDIYIASLGPCLSFSFFLSFFFSNSWLQVYKFTFSIGIRLFPTDIAIMFVFASFHREPPEEDKGSAR